MMMVLEIALTVLGILVLVLCVCGISMYKELERLNGNITKLNEKIEDKTETLPNLHAKVNDLESNVVSLDNRMTESISNLDSKLEETLNDIINVYEKIEDDEIGLSEICEKIEILEELSEILKNNLDDFKEEMENNGVDPIEALQLYLNKLSDDEIEDDYEINMQMSNLPQTDPEEEISFNSLVKIVKDRMNRRKRD